jgi:serine/threonine-protein kinase
MLEVVSEELHEGLVVSDKYRLARPVGQGGMGVVWAATHVVTGKRCALKFLKAAYAADPRSHGRFLREARAACAVRHPNAAEIHDVLELESGIPVLVMDLLEGETLAERLAREGKLAWPEARAILVDVVDAVSAAHAVGVVHRDLKPENIFLEAAGRDVRERGARIKVLDFGIAKVLRGEPGSIEAPSITGTGDVVGTSFYMAPEQVYGEADVDGRADVWALGVTFYEALSGRRPTQGACAGQVFKAITHAAFRPLEEPGVPDAVSRIVMRMLSRDRAERPDLAAVRAALDERRAINAGATVEERRRGRLVALAGAAVALAAAAFVAARHEPSAVRAEPAIAASPPLATEGAAPPSPVPTTTAPLSIVGMDRDAASMESEGAAPALRPAKTLAPPPARAVPQVSSAPRARPGPPGQVASSGIITADRK